MLSVAIETAQLNLVERKQQGLDLNELVVYYAFYAASVNSQKVVSNGSIIYNRSISDMHRSVTFQGYNVKRSMYISYSLMLLHIVNILPYDVTHTLGR